jgi:hypothetical protein
LLFKVTLNAYFPAVLLRGQNFSRKNKKKGAVSISVRPETLFAEFLYSLLPGPRRVCLQFYGKNSAKFEKILHFCHSVIYTGTGTYLK